VQQVVQRPRTRIAIAIGVAALLIIAFAAGIFYIFGGNGAKSSSGLVAAPTLAPSGGSGTVFTIDSAASQTTFSIDEVLFGQPNTVVGQTSAVAGQIRIDRDDPSRSQVGQIKVDVSALTTDNDLRNRTLQNRILETGDPSNQFATFTPKTVTGLPARITTGQPVPLTVTGDLTIHGTTRGVTFNATVTLVSATQLNGQATATVKYADFGLAIPDVPSVTGVGSTVKLALSFTAKA
jgi:polyisoprenoid-binding protein YceI